MARRRSDAHRAVRWLWTSPGVGARVTRAALLPLSGLWRMATRIRAGAYALRWLHPNRLPRPSVAVGNLSVGGSGKTPISAWIADYFAGRGIRPAVLLRGVGDDEPDVHRDLVPAAIVVADPDRLAGAARAVAAGAEVLVLDDAYQRLDVARDLNICLISAESSQAVTWPLPAGPWREGRDALRRADIVIVTRKRADAGVAARLADELRNRGGYVVGVARLDLGILRGLVSQRERALATLRGQRVVVASAIADPESFVQLIKRIGAQVQVATWGDHHQFRDEDVAWLARAAQRADAVVITAKDAVKLRGRWPASVPVPWVATLNVTFEAGADDIHAALDRVVAPKVSSEPC